MIDLSQGVSWVKAYSAAELRSKYELVVKVSEVLAGQVPQWQERFTKAGLLAERSIVDQPYIDKAVCFGPNRLISITFRRYEKFKKKHVLSHNCCDNGMPPMYSSCDELPLKGYQIESSQWHCGKL